nr:MAG TPA: Ima1 N-terminal domain [Caudoviricetes sp.]
MIWCDKCEENPYIAWDCEYCAETPDVLCWYCNTSYHG